MVQLTLRDADESDLPFIVGLIASDPVADQRSPSTPEHDSQQREALHAITLDPNLRLLVALCDGEPVGSFQLAFLPGVSRQGAWRGQIEAVRVAPQWQGRGIGSAMMEWAIEQCRNRGCGLVQLTSDNSRTDAHRFYERLGFCASHTGFKLKLSSPG